MASLFDTGAFESLRRGEREITALAIRVSPPIICLHVVAEVLYGARWAGVGAEALDAARAAVEEYEVLYPGLDTALIYAQLRASTRSAGQQMPDPDLWIAAHAIEGRLTLVTLDHHFTFFDELNVHLLA